MSKNYFAALALVAVLFMAGNAKADLQSATEGLFGEHWTAGLVPESNLVKPDDINPVNVNNRGPWGAGFQVINHEAGTEYMFALTGFSLEDFAAVAEVFSIVDHGAGVGTWVNVGSFLDLLGLSTGNGIFVDGDTTYLKHTEITSTFAYGDMLEFAWEAYSLPVGTSLALYEVKYNEPPNPNPAPEPATLALVGLGLAGLGIARARRRK